MLTGRQAAVLRAIVAALLEGGRPATVREVCARIGARSPGTVARHMAALRRKGYLGAGTRVLLSPEGAPFDLRAATLADTSPNVLAEHLAGRPDAGALAEALRPLLPPHE